jgi:hypothetical protein
MVGASKRRHGVFCDGAGAERTPGKRIRIKAKAKATKAMRLIMFASPSGYQDAQNTVMKCES